MTSSLVQRWAPRLLTLLVWALVALSVAQWTLRWGDGAASAAGAAPALVGMTPALGAPDSAAVARVLGAAEATAAPTLAAPARFQLSGVVAATPSGRGAALIGIDGKPARSYAVGARLEEGTYLVAVAPRQAQLGTSASGPVTVSLEMPAKK